MKKQFKYIIIGIFCFSFFSGCEKQTNNTLTVVMNLAEKEWNVFREHIFPLYENKYNLKIKSYQIESGQLVTKLQALINAGKSEIDVFAQDNMNLAELVDKKLILNLNNYRSTVPQQIIPNLIQTCKFNNKLMFMPFRPNVQIVYYNSDAFNKYNLNLPKTWSF